MFINSKGKALEASSSREGASLRVGVKNSGPEQRFEIVYSEKATAMKTTGMSEEFGLHIGRPFILISQNEYGGKAIEVDKGGKLVLSDKRYNFAA
jgi:hypothetical protein